MRAEFNAQFTDINQSINNLFYSQKKRQQQTNTMK